MTKLTFVIFVATFVLMSCNTGLTSNKSEGTALIDSDQKILRPHPPKYHPDWLNTNSIRLSIDSSLSYKQKGFTCDSAIFLDYEGAFGENAFLPINEKGQWINTIKGKMRLSEDQVVSLKSIVGAKSSYKNPIIIGCYEPRLAIVYFKAGSVIGQTAICLDCARLESTIQLGNNTYYSSFNEKTRDLLFDFYKNSGLQLH